MTEETTQDTVATEAAVSNLRIMDEELYKRLDGMFSSSDKGHWPIAEDILMTVDVDKSIYWMYKLMRAHWWRFNRRRKMVREKITQHPILGRIVGKGEYAFAEWLVQEKRMTEEIWTRMSAIVIYTIEQKSKNSFFNIELKLKPELW